MKIHATFRPLVTGIFLVALSVPATAQVAVSPRTGEVVRVETLGAPKPVQGRLVALDADSLILEADRRVAIARAQVTNVWVTVGQRRNTWRGIGIGFGAGAGIGALLGATTYEPCVETGFMSCFMAPESAGQAAMYGAAAGGVFGFLLGGIVGFTTKRDVWEPVGVPTTVGVAPAGHGRVSLSLRIGI